MKYITLRSLQQYLYCPKRWGLMNINCDWVSNAFIVLGDIVHKRVDNPKLDNIKGCNKIIERAVPVVSKKYGLTGKIDQLELLKVKNGTYIKKYDGRFNVNIIEYKRSKPKKKDYNLDDAVQVYAQKVCLDEMLQSNCNIYLYYADIRKRFKIHITEEINSMFHYAIDGIKTAFENNIVPDILDNQNCNGCSFKDVCMPKCYNNSKSIKKYILEQNEKIK